MAISAAQLVVSLQAQGARETEGAINRVSGAVDKASGGFDAFYASIQGGAGQALRALDGISRAMGAIAVMGGITLLAGGAKAAWNQVDAVQQATVALRAYETDARKVDDVLKDLLAFARSDQGKLFMRQELFHAAQAMKVAGAETENLARYTEILSRSVSSGMGTWNELERVISRVGSTGRLAGEDFEMLQKMGFQLDASLRNTTITWEELFDVLDRASVKVEGQSETIQGRMMTLQTAIRGVGLAFLDINSETSMFNEGGLGDRIMSGLEMAPALLKSVAEGARELGNAIVGAIDFVTNMVRAFQMLPGPVQSAAGALLKVVTAFGALRVAGKAMGMIGALTGLGGITGLMGGGGAAGGARGLSTAIGGLIGRINPLGLAIGGVIALGASWVNSFMQQKQAVEDYGASVTTLTATLESLRRQGLRDRATQGEGLAGIIDNIDERSLEMMERWGEGYENFDADELKRYTEFQEVSIAQQEQLNSLLNEALLDPNVDVDAWMSWVTTLLTGADNAEELRAAVELIIATPLSDFAIDSADSMDGLNDAMVKVGATAAEVSEIFADLPSRLDDLRIDGLSRQAADIEQLGTALEAAFKPVVEYQKDRYGQDTGVFTIIDELDATKLETLAGSWERISDALASGDFDNARLMADVMEVIADPSLSMDQKADEIDNIANSLVNYRNIAAEVLALMGRGGLTSMLGLAGIGGEAVQFADNVNRASASLDDTFRVIVGNTNAIGSQIEGVKTWADELINVTGEYGKIDDLLAKNLITQEQYNDAQRAYNVIGMANAQVQNDILTIQAQQAPLIAAQTNALAQYMREIRLMNDGTVEGMVKQQAALGFMDQGMQESLGNVIELGSQMKQMGPEGEAAFRQMAEGIAASNPILFSMMEQVGLVTDVVRDADGTVLSFEVNLDGADSVLNAINALTESIDVLIVTLGGTPPALQAAIDAMHDYGRAARDATIAALGLADAQPTPGPSNDAPTVTGLPGAGSGNQLGNVGNILKPVVLDVFADTTNADKAINDLAANPPTVNVPVSVTMANAGASAGGAAAGLASDIFSDVSIKIDADTSGWDTALENATALDGSTIATTYVWAIGNDDSAANMISHYQGRSNETLAEMMVWAIADDTSAANMISHYQGLDGSTLASMYVWAIGNADSATNMINAMSAYNGVTLATTYVDLVTRRIGDNIVGRATGGMVSEDMTLVGELGPELVSLPRGSYVHTNAESMRMMSGSGNNQSAPSKTTQVSVTFAGDFYGSNREELDEWADSRLVPAFVAAINDERRGQAR